MAGIAGMRHGHKPVYDYTIRKWKCKCGHNLFVTFQKNDSTVTRHALTETEARQAMAIHRRNLPEKKVKQ